MQRALTVDNLMNKKFKDMNFEGKWKDSFGLPELKGAWLIWGASGNGKTSFSLQLAKYLTNFSKVAYNTLEEGAGKSFFRAIAAANMQEVASKFIILDREPMNELKERLRRKRSPGVIVIDSFQYTGMTRSEYIALKEEFPNKLFIFVSHAEGKNPSGRTANFIRYDVDIKIRIEGYVAHPISRYGGGEPFIIWEQGAADYLG